jgi:hypothetical protein
MSINFFESVRTKSPSDMMVDTHDISVARWKYLYYPQNVNDLINVPTQILGTTYDLLPTGNPPTTTNVQLNRLTPVVHPCYPWLYASKIIDTDGLGTGQDANFITQNALNEFNNRGLIIPTNTGNNPIAPTYFQPPAQEHTIQFQTYAYNIFPNIAVQTYPTNTWWNLGGTAKNFIFSNEYIRYFEVEQQPLSEYVSMQGGNTMTLFGSLNANNALARIQFQGLIKQYMPDSVVKFRLYGVPQRWVYSANCNFNRFQGFINQRQFPFYQTVSNIPTWSPGQLLYVNYRFTRFTQARLPILGEDTTSFPALCDVEFDFLATRRFNSTPATIGGQPPPINNNNFINGGWNLLPSRQQANSFYYAYDRNTFIPAFYSAPIPDIFFCDPDNATNQGVFA